MEVPSYLKILDKDSPLKELMLFHCNLFLVETFLVEKFRDPAQF
jgi:hypothetical protein